MSKIAEQKVKELGYSKDTFNRQEFTANDIFDCGVECYDQAMQDFLEKAERYLKNTLYDRVEIEVYGTLIPDFIGKKEFIENFKNYMKNESEN